MTPRVLLVLHKKKEILPELSNKAGVSMLEGKNMNRKLNCKTKLVMKQQVNNVKQPTVIKGRSPLTQSLSLMILSLSVSHMLPMHECN